MKNFIHELPVCHKCGNGTNAFSVEEREIDGTPCKVVVCNHCRSVQVVIPCVQEKLENIEIRLDDLEASINDFENQQHMSLPNDVDAYIESELQK